MDITIIQKYFERNLGIFSDFSVAAISKLPHFARRQFDFFTVTLFEKTICLLLARKENFQDYNLQELESINQLIREQSNYLGVFVFQCLSKKERLILIKRRIPFIVPDTQMFIPQLAVDLFDRIPTNIPVKSTQLRPAAQAILLTQLLTESLQGLSVNKAAQVLGYSAMGTLRAVNQLHALKLCDIAVTGRDKRLAFSSDKKKLWMDASSYLRNPVKKVVAVESDTNLSTYPLAGEYALSLHSDLSVHRKCYAIHETQFKDLFDSGRLQIADTPNGGTADVQVWIYNLSLWSHEVDLLSLELSFKGNEDPRIKIALLELEEHRKW